ncbi:MAG: efflux RND transporter periplasmic adaptor subunit, partial [Opitutales bacterium]|nr:efflux RND transporter periplasmic adaptor subunit [Opitutales bacterium]
MKKAETLFAVLIAAACVAGCAKTAEAPRQIPPAPVVLGEAEQRDVFKFIDTLGTTSSFQSVKIVPQVTGQIVKINFKQGDYVKEGDILVEIDKRQYHAGVLAAEAAVAKAKSQLKIDELDASRNKKLAEQNFVSKQTYDSLVAAVESDKAALKSAEAELETAKINLDWCDVRAPISGKAGFFNIDLGNVVNANSQNSMITTIEQTDKLYVDFFVPSARQFEVQSLMKERGGSLDLDVACVDGKVSNGKTVKAKVVAVENRARYSSSTLVLRGFLDNKDFVFWPDQSVKVSLELDEVKGAVLVDNAAVQVDNVGHFVYVAEHGEGGVYRVKKV